MFNIHIKTTVRILGCPRDGIAALDWRRAHSIPGPERGDNKFAIEADVEDESAFRRLVAAGATTTSLTDGTLSLELRDDSSRTPGWPLLTQHGGGHGRSYGWRASVPASVIRSSDPIEIAESICTDDGYRNDRYLTALARLDSLEEEAAKAVAKFDECSALIESAK